MDRYSTARVSIILGSIAAAWVIGYHIQVNYLSAPWMVGGSVCETSMVDGQEVLGCFGYPPVGVVVLGGAFLALTWPLQQAVRALEQRVEVLDNDG